MPTATAYNLANPNPANNLNYYKDNSGTFVNVNSADASLQGGRIYSAEEAGVAQTSPVTSLSTDNGAQTLNKKLTQLNNISPKTSPGYNPPADTSNTGSGSTTVPPKAYFTNASGQEAEYTQDQLNDPTTQKFLGDNGYVQTKTEGPNYNPGSGLQGDLATADKRLDDLATKFLTYNVDQDPAFQSQASAITAQFSQLRDDLKQLNYQRAQSLQHLGYRYGTTQYAGSVQSGLESEELNQANKRLSDLSLKESQAISAARQAFQDGKFSEFSKQLDAVKTIRDNKQKALDSYNKGLESVMKNIQDEKDALAKVAEQTKKDINGILTDLAKNNAPQNIIAAVSNAKSVPEAIKASGDYLQTAGGSAGEYLFYKRDALARGLVPVDPDTYFTIDANRKAIAANAATGLNPKQTQNFLAITTKFQADPFINVALQGQTAISIADQVIADPGKATNQLKSLYILVKNLDPNSAVREGEISLADKTQSYLSRFSNSLTRIGEGRVISPSAAKELAIATKELATAWNTTAKKRETQYKAQANGVGVGDAFNEYLQSSNLSYSTGQKAIETETQAESALKNYVTSNPDKQAEINTRIQSIEKTLGRPATSLEFLEAFPEYGTFSSVGGDTNLASNRPTRNNNPLNIKMSSATSTYPGVTGFDPSPAADGGKFLTFNSPEDGFNAAKKLITSPGYLNLSVDAALKRWSNTGYGGEIAPGLSGKRVKDLSATELDSLIKIMARHEGYLA